MKSMYSKVSIITINFHSLKHTVDLLDSINDNPYPNLEVIVVDNESTFDPTESLEAFYLGVKVLRSERNLGFAGANNLGIEVATGDYLFFLNNDTEITDDCIFQLVYRLSENQRIGAISPKIKYFETNLIQYAGFTPIHPFTGRNQLIGKGEVDEEQHDILTQTAYAHGAAMMVRKEVIEEVGKMPECYFLYYEELDWCEAISKNYDIYFEPNAVVYHKESASVGKSSPLKTYYQTRNRVVFMYRNFRFPYFLVFLLFFLGFSLPKAVFYQAICYNFQHIKSLFIACYDAFQLLRNRKFCKTRFSVPLATVNPEGLVTSASI